MAIATKTSCMIHKIYRPSPELEEIVEYYWYSRKLTNTPSVQECPTPLLQGLAFSFRKNEEHHAYDGKEIHLYKKGYFFGQPTCPRTITNHEKGAEILGVKFKPLGIAKITGVNMVHLTDACIAAEDIWSGEFELLCDEMQSAANTEGSILVLEKFLAARLSQVKQPYYLNNVSNALSLIHHSYGSVHIKEIQLQTNTTKKTLERNFTQAIGLKPKLYAQIVRFNFAKDRLDRLVAKQRIADVAYSLGYFNHSHLASDFRRFAGVTPKQYLQGQLR